MYHKTAVFNHVSEFCSEGSSNNFLLCCNLVDYLTKTPIEEKLEQIIDFKDGRLDINYREEAMDAMTYA